MALQEANALLTATASISTLNNAFYRNTDAVEYIQGEIDNALVATASMVANASTLGYIGSGSSGTGSGSVSVGYPSNSTNGRLVLFAGAFKKHTDPFFNANFKRAGWACKHIYYQYERTVEGRTAANNLLGTDIGPTRVEHHVRYLTDTASGSETFTTSGTTNLAAAGQMYLFGKSGAEEWIVKSYGAFNSGEDATTNAYPYELQFNQYFTSQFKVTNSAIRGIANNPGVCTLLCAEGREIWKTTTGFEWSQLPWPSGFGTDNPYRMRFGNGVFIMVGANGKVARSTDNGASWTVTQPLGSGFIWYGLRYYNNRWIACGAGGRLMTSDDDGLNWTQRTSGVTTIIYDVAWGSGYYENPGWPEGNRPAWNNGVGIWWYAAQNYRMFRSNDNGDTWTEGTYQTTSPAWNQSFMTSWSPYAIVYADSTYGQFSAAGSNLGNYFDYGYYQNAINHGKWESDDEIWYPYYSGYSYGFLWYGQWISGMYGRFAILRDWVVLPASNGWSTSQWCYASSLYDGIMIGQSETYPSATQRPYYLDGYSAEFQILGKPYKEWEEPPDPRWNTVAAYDDGGTRDYRFGGALSEITGYANGEVRIQEHNGPFEDLGTDGENVGYNAHMDLRDGDIVVVSISVSSSSDVLTGISLERIKWESTDYYYWNDGGISFSDWNEIGVVSSTSGDRVKIYTGYFLVYGDPKVLFYEDNWYGTTNSSHWNWIFPSYKLTFDGDHAANIHAGYNAVFTVLRSQTFGIDMEAKASLAASAEVRKVGVQPGAPGSEYTVSMIADAFVEKNTTPTYLGAYSIANETSNNYLVDYVYSPTNGIPAGSLVVVMIVADNLSATTPTITVTDQQSNTYTQLGFKGQNASANAGVVGGIFYSVLTTALQYGNNITASFSGNITCKGMVYIAFSGVGTSGQRSTAVTASGSSATPTVTSGSVSAGDLVVAMAGIENSTVPTADSDTLNGSWASYIAATGTGGNAATHQSLYAAYKIVNASGAQTFNPATSPSTDWVEIIGVFAVPTVKQTAAVMRANASMTVETTVNYSYSTTASLDAVADMDSEAEWVEGNTPIGVLNASVQDATDNMADIWITLPTTSEDLEAVADMVVEAWVPILHQADADLEAVADLTADCHVQVWHTAEVSLEAVASTHITQGDLHYADATMTASAQATGNGSYVNAGTNPSNPDDDTQPIIPAPETLPGTDGWHSATSVYGSTGRTGNLVELTNRHYQDAYRAACEWPEWPFPNGPGGFWGMGVLGTYTLGARACTVTPLGDDRFLVVWSQENWVQYYLDWYSYGNPIQRVLMDVPMVLVATVLDCSGDGDPVIAGTTRYDLPLGWRWYRNGHGQSAQPMGNGKVACTFSGFMIIPDDHDIDYGTLNVVTTDSANLVCVVDASTDTPSFQWVKKFGGYWNGHRSFINEIMIHDGNVLVTRYGYVSANVEKFDGSNGSHLGSSTVIGNVADAPNGRASCVYEGDYGYLMGDNGYLFVYRRINLNTLAWDDLANLTYNGDTVNPNGFLYKSKKGPDGKWYAAGTTSDSGAYSIFKFNISDGVMTVEAIHRSSVPNVNSYDEETLLPYNNAYRTYNWTEVWVPYNYVNNTYLYSLYTKQNFTPGIQNPSVVGTAAYITSNSQYPEHQKGPQCVAGIPAMDADNIPMKPKAWISYPSGDNPTNWSHYFADGRPEFVSDIDCAELSNGKILVVIAGVEDLLDAGEDANGNGIYRIFTYIVDPQDDPPPLKLAQRDDDKVAGSQRIGYDPQQESTIRAGWVAW